MAGGNFRLLSEDFPPLPQTSIATHIPKNNLASSHQIPSGNLQPPLNFGSFPVTILQSPQVDIEQKSKELLRTNVDLSKNRSEIATDPHKLSSIAKAFHGISLITPPNSINGTPCLTLTPGAKDRLTSKFGQIIVAKFSMRKPLFQDFVAYLNKLNFVGQYKILKFDLKHVLIDFEVFEDFVKLWLVKHCLIKGFKVRFFHWRENFHPSTESWIAPVWIHFPALPLHLIEEETILSIASLFGKLLFINPLNLDLVNVGYLSICVAVDVRSRGPSEFWVETVGEGILVDRYKQTVLYGAVPPYCPACRHIGHCEKECKVANMEEIDAGTAGKGAAETVMVATIFKRLKNLEKPHVDNHQHPTNAVTDSEPPKQQEAKIAEINVEQALLNAFGAVSGEWEAVESDLHHALAASLMPLVETGNANAGQEEGNEVLAEVPNGAIKTKIPASPDLSLLSDKDTTAAGQNSRIQFPASPELMHSTVLPGASLQPVFDKDTASARQFTQQQEHPSLQKASCQRSKMAEAPHRDYVCESAMDYVQMIKKKYGRALSPPPPSNASGTGFYMPLVNKFAALNAEVIEEIEKGNEAESRNDTVGVQHGISNESAKSDPTGGKGLNSQQKIRLGAHILNNIVKEYKASQPESNKQMAKSDKKKKKKTKEDRQLERLEQEREWERERIAIKERCIPRLSATNFNRQAVSAPECYHESMEFPGIDPRYFRNMDFFEEEKSEAESNEYVEELSLNELSPADKVSSNKSLEYLDLNPGFSRYNLRVRKDVFYPP